ncbi:acyl-CoA dehydrogenase family protein [Hoeflea poritis]|uniref:Acyl-CoA dehydrogenase family protein n=1 Tax=Hoeflea poritis TaxID=2993659 RepID=A0ABT4VGI4_9HYPH|nr:acyl-CoA dehydrogenase family protein [Hoeflea poritis]MDA4843815.1 acyl-CoA dehydrogenase family protein [Hoeflea poritis]
MDLNYTDEELTFRDEVRSFLDSELPASLSNKVKAGKRLTKEDMENWHAILNRRGWLAESWPVEYGGTGWNAVERQIFEDESCAAGAPRTVPFGLKMLAPVLMKYGSEEQKNHYLPRILDGTDWWCQGYSEPGAGSDLASLKMRAVRDGDHYVVNGQKTWTTLGQHANMIFCLVRTSTDGKPQEGISFILVDMDTPGVTVRPIILLEGTHEVNEVFFDDVRVPVTNLVGEENKGWTYAKYLLTHERTNIANVGANKVSLDHLKYIGRTQKKRGRPLIEDPLFAARLAQIEMELDAMATTNLRLLSSPDSVANAGPMSSMLKIKGTEIRQALNDLTRRALGPYAMPFVSEALDAGFNEEPIGPDYAAPVSQEYFNNRKITIYGGSNEIQRGIITKMMMGL